MQVTDVTIRFGPFTLDLDTRQLTQEGREIHLAPKAFELLVALVLDRPKVLSKTVLQQRLWPDTFVAEANLSNLVAEIRQALGDRARTPRFVRTAHGFGYAFCGDATTLPATGDAGSGPPSCWLEWGTRRFPLSAGEHVIGRDPDVEVRLDASTVSRRHARLVVTAGGTVLEDFGSKNGTFRGKRTRDLASPARRWRCHPHRIAARDLPCARTGVHRDTRAAGHPEFRGLLTGEPALLLHAVRARFGETLASQHSGQGSEASVHGAADGAPDAESGVRPGVGIVVNLGRCAPVIGPEVDAGIPHRQHAVA